MFPLLRFIRVLENDSSRSTPEKQKKTVCSKNEILSLSRICLSFENTIPTQQNPSKTDKKNTSIEQKSRNELSMKRQID